MAERTSEGGTSDGLSVRFTTDETRLMLVGFEVHNHSHRTVSVKFLDVVLGDVLQSYLYAPGEVEVKRFPGSQEMVCTVRVTVRPGGAPVSWMSFPYVVS